MEIGHGNPHQRRHRRRHGDFPDQFLAFVPRRLGRELSSRFVVTERKTLYLSPVHFTLYTRGRERIDDQALGRIG